MKQKIYILLAILLVAGFSYYYFNRDKFQDKIELPKAQSYDDIKANENIIVTDKNPTSTPPKNNPTTTVTTVPPKEPVVKPAENLAAINLAVPFTSQAPTANWAEPFQNACEEASLIMVEYYYENKKMPDKLAVEKIIVDMVAWQVKTWGVHPELPIAKEADLALAMYNQKTEIVNNLTVEKIKDLLRQGRPVIVSADGKKLANPNFTNGGPVYHMLVIKGFTGDKFITNDPGTRLGADFIYTQDNLMYSLADWDENKNAATGGKVGLVFTLR
jgi:hypothetical protein